MLNEKITENIVRKQLQNLGYYDQEDIFVEEQQSINESVRKLLKTAGKAGKGGSGYPEFIVSTLSQPDFLIIFECKASVSNHQSAELDKPVQFAVDGVLHYSKSLSKEFSVIGIAVSGQTESELKISNFIWPHGADNFKILENESKKKIEQIVSFNDYIKLGTFDPAVQAKRTDDLMAFSRELHEFMRDHAKLSESQKPLLVSGTLIALRNDAFSSSFDKYSPEDLQQQWLRTITDEIKKADIPYSKKENMTQPYSSIAIHPELGKSTPRFPKGVLYELIKMLNDRVWPFINQYHDFDVVGRFYGEFLKYTGGDKKSLGIVLTPRHITELFSLIANVNKNSKVYDPCCGTGGFLISAMQKMMQDTSTEEEKDNVRKFGLYGVEQQPSMYALAASNMILRGDGKANLHQGSCFDEAINTEIRKINCDVGMVNPPYSQKDEESRELVFVREMLDTLTKGGIGMAIVPMSCAISPNPIKEELLKHHTLDAVMSMPDELFYPVGVVTCIMVFKAHTPHQKSDQRTWFGYWKSDGFIKTKQLGRIDLNNQWSEIKKRWIDAYRNRDAIAGESVKYPIDAMDEWCAEAYMDTDYSTLSKEDFEKTVQDYAIFKLLNEAKTNEVA